MIPHGLCQCGCGGKTSLAAKTREKYGHIKGQPVRFIKGHALNGAHRHSYDVDSATGCWIWQGKADNGAGYAQMSHRGQRTYAHRWAYEQLVGPIPKGLDIDHLCRNRRCCNPEHLEPVTRAENLRRGREARKVLNAAGSA